MVALTRLLLLILLVVVSEASPLQRSLVPVAVNHVGNDWTLTNGFVFVTVSTAGGSASISSLRGDFEGIGSYGEELLAGSGFWLESLEDGKFHSSLNGTSATVKMISNSSTLGTVEVSGVSAGSAVETWVVSLASGERGFDLNISGSVSPNWSQEGGGVVKHSLLATPLSVYGFYPEVYYLSTTHTPNVMRCAR